MTTFTRRCIRLFALALVAAAFSACHFHGHCGGWHSHCHSHARSCR